MKSGTNEYTITNGETQFYAFTPTKTATYYFYSVSAQDTYGWLIDGDQGIALFKDDDNGNGYNFMLEAELTAGKTYYIGANFLSAWSSTKTVTTKK